MSIAIAPSRPNTPMSESDQSNMTIKIEADYLNVSRREMWEIDNVICSSNLAEQFDRILQSNGLVLGKSVKSSMRSVNDAIKIISLADYSVTISIDVIESEQYLFERAFSHIGTLLKGILSQVIVPTLITDLTITES